MAYSTNTTIVAAFRNAADAEAAAQDLQTAGISRDHIYLENSSAKSASSGSSSAYESRTQKHEGGFTGWFKSLFEEDTDTNDHAPYEKALSEGGYLLSVDATEDQVGSIEVILNRHSPLNVHNDESSVVANDAVGGTTNAAVGTTSRTADAGQAIPVVEEELQVGKRQVLRGGVRVYSRVVEEPVEESVDLREEHVRVDRQTVNRAATAADFTSGQEQVIEVAEFAEEPVIAKQARVVEEIRVGKDVTERTESVRETLRHTEVEVEQIPGGAATAGAYDDSAFRQDFQTRYASTGETYDTYSPAYKYGYDAASDSRYHGKKFADVENDLRSDYNTRYPGGTWEKMKDSVRSGWDKVTGKA